MSLSVELSYSEKVVHCKEADLRLRIPDVLFEEGR